MDIPNKFLTTGRAAKYLPFSGPQLRSMAIAGELKASVYIKRNEQYSSYRINPRVALGEISEITNPVREDHPAGRIILDSLGL